MEKNIKEKYTPVTLGLVLILWLFPLLTRGQNQESEPPQFTTGKTPGKFEVGIHYSGWSLNLIKGSFEDKVIDELGEEIRDEIASYLRDNQHLGLVKTVYEQDFVFDSGGHNYGLELRFYPQGREGPFSLGLSFEKAKMQLTLTGDVKQSFEDGSLASADASGEILLNPFFTHLTFRWDLMPTWRITPYIVLGFGVAALNGEFQYEYKGIYEWRGPDETIEDSDLRDIQEAEEDIEFNIPNIFPLLQASLGVRVEIIPNLHMKAGAGFWNGFILRAGISGRF